MLDFESNDEISTEGDGKDSIDLKTYTASDLNNSKAASLLVGQRLDQQVTQMQVKVQPDTGLMMSK